MRPRVAGAATGVAAATLAVCLALAWTALPGSRSEPAPSSSPTSSLDATPSPTGPTGLPSDPTEPSEALCVPPLDRAPHKVPALIEGQVLVHEFPAVELGADLDWSANPFDHPSFQSRLHNLEWIRPLVAAAADGDDRAGERAREVLHDWIEDNPRDVPLHHAWSERPTGLRTGMLTCAAAVIGMDDTLDGALRRHAAELKDPENYAGSWNHGLDQDIGLLLAACATGDDASFSMAVARATDTVLDIVDQEGVSHEQAITYHKYNYVQIGRILHITESCGGDLDPRVLQRHRLMPEFLAHATEPGGTYVQIGDMARYKAEAIDGTVAEHPATNGREGRPPPSNVRIFEDSGYAFGRTFWPSPEQQDEASFYALRFGPPRQIHGHHDHMSFTWIHEGTDILTEGGFVGYEDTPFRAWTQMPQAHNVVVAASGSDVQWTNPDTSLEASETTGERHRYLLTDQPYEDVTRTRDMTIDLTAGEASVIDTIAGDTPRAYTQLWHLPPTSRVSIDGNVVTALMGQRKLEIEQQVPVDSITVVSGETGPFQGWVSRRMGQRREAPVVVATVSGVDAEWRTRLSVSDRGVR